MQGFRKIRETWKIHVIDHNQRTITLLVNSDESLADYHDDIDWIFDCDITYRGLRISPYEPIRSYYNVALSDAIYLSDPNLRQLVCLYGCPQASDSGGLVPECMLSTFEGFRKIEY